MNKDEEELLLLVDKAKYLFEEERELRIILDNSKDELIKLKDEHYNLLCHAILKMYWYENTGDIYNFNDVFQKLVKIAEQRLGKME